MRVVPGLQGRRDAPRDGAGGSGGVVGRGSPLPGGASSVAVTRPMVEVTPGRRRYRSGRGRRRADGGGRVVLAATPIGRPDDATPRLREALADGRRAGRRGHPPAAAAVPRSRREPAGRIVSFFDANETGRVPQLLEALRGGADVLVVTDAGMPSVSDPGYRLVAAAVGRGLRR